MYGFHQALSEITLVLFTTMAPSGIVAFLVPVIRFLAGRDGDLGTLQRLVVMPYLFALVGLIASATHLGSPQNALYVLTGVGRSPLSNEVFFAVLFFGLSNIFWLSTFSRTRRPAAEKVGLFLVAGSAVAFLLGIAFAYHVPVIISWYSALVPLMLFTSALVGGPVLSLVNYALVSPADLTPRHLNVALTVSVAAVGFQVAFDVLNMVRLFGLSNSIFTIFDLMGNPVVFSVASCALFAAGLLLFASRRQGLLAIARPWDVRRLKVHLLALALVFIGIFIERFAFYMSHMVVGISL